MTQLISSLAEISDAYEAVFCDLWGCVHNGRAAFPEAVAALHAFRAKGGGVVLLTNAPRPSWGIKGQLEHLGVPDDAYDVVVSSGDAAQAAMVAGEFRRRVYHIGPDKDLVFFQDENGRSLDIERVPLEAAEGIVCTGLFDDQTETPEDYSHTFMTGINRGLKMLCANPDIVVDVGDKRIYCAGALAEAYAQRGGDVQYFGKPHPPIYALARQRLTDLARLEVPDENILAIGDGIATDVSGALGEGLDALFISGGLAAEETGTADSGPDPKKLADFLASHQMTARYAIGFLK